MSCIQINSNVTKKEIIEKIKSTFQDTGNDVYISSESPEYICNIIFSADVFRRHGHIVSIDKIFNYETNELNICVFISKCIAVLDKQITREDNLKDLKNFEISYDTSVLNIKACGTAIRLAWDYCNYLIINESWFLTETTMNAIPVKINEKNIFKTTLQFKLMRLIETTVDNLSFSGE
mgnify:CR=1 FL=1